MGSARMRMETISIHGGFVRDPATKAVAPPIYQNVAYEFDSADHAAALFNLEVPGFRYSRISNPTTDILEKRIAQLEGGFAGLAVASGQAALAYAFMTLADRGGSIVAPPQLYGTTHTLLAHTLRRTGIEARFAASERPNDIVEMIDDTTRAVFCEFGRQSRRQCLRPWRACRRGAFLRAAVACRQHGRNSHSIASNRARRRYRNPLFDKIHRRTWRRDGRGDHRFPAGSTGHQTGRGSRCFASQTNPITDWSMSTTSVVKPLSRVRARCISARWALFYPH